MNEFLKLHCRCPNCRKRPLIFSYCKVICDQCNSEFPIVGEVPALIRHDNEVFPLASYLNVDFNLDNQKSSLLATVSKFIPSPSVNLSYAGILKELANELCHFNPAYVLVVGSGQQKDGLEKYLEEFDNIQLFYCDVSIESTVDLFCDAHELPFVDQVFHGIIITAVLEHVLYPDRVIGEVHRVLVEGGLLYSEAPFMQQVHEGAYDFTRYSLSGHRLLLNQFQELSSGMVAGPGTALVWAIENFALCFAHSRTLQLLVKSAIRMIFFWIKYFDYLFKDNSQAMDSASCTYFLGKKYINTKTPDRVIIERYVGAKNIRHV